MAAAALKLLVLSAAAILLLVVFPSLAGRSRWQEAARVFLRTAFFFVITCLLLGTWQVCSADAVAAAYFLYLLGCAHFQRGIRAPAWRPPLLAFSAVVAATLVPGWFAVSNLRFLSAVSLDRARSLQALMEGRAAPFDASAALLAPLAHGTGFDSSFVVRMSHPILLTALCLATGYLAYRWCRRMELAAMAAALGGGWLTLTGRYEMAAPEIAAIFWLLALATAQDDWAYAAVAALLAILNDWRLEWHTTAAMAACAAAAFAAARATPPLAPPGRFIAYAVAAACWAVTAAGPDPGRPSVQYEAAARVTAEIAESLPRGSWRLIGADADGALIAGRGAHTPLDELITTFDAESVAAAGFQFPFREDNIFFLVERRPLVPPGPGSLRDDASYYYSTRSGRASLAFQAAQLLAAYARTHRDLHVYYSDADIAVYWLRRGAITGS